MTGSLQVKNDKFYLVLNTYENGKRKPKWIATGLEVKGNKRRAEQLLRDTLSRYDRLNICPKTDVRVSDYVRTWLSIAKRSVDAVTYHGYEELSTLHVLPYFDANGMMLQRAGTADLQAYFDEKQRSGRLDGKGGLSARSLRLHKNILHQTFKLAQKNGLIASNPCEFLILPKNERFMSSFYSADQMQQLFDAVKDDILYPLIKITALYGLRRSEALGLQWDSIDFQRGLLTIRHTVCKAGGLVEKDKTKNASSYRSFPLIGEAREIFLSLKAQEEANRRLLKSAYHESSYVFKWDDGRPIAPDYVTHHFEKLLKRHNLPHIRFHELRHSCASLLINAGFTLKDVQEWLGHADIQMTANIYGHLDVSRKQSMAQALTSTLHAE